MSVFKFALVRPESIGSSFRLSKAIPSFAIPPGAGLPHFTRTGRKPAEGGTVLHVRRNLRVMAAILKKRSRYRPRMTDEVRHPAFLPEESGWLSRALNLLRLWLRAAGISGRES